jgi:hypothetical protein
MTTKPKTRKAPAAKAAAPKPATKGEPTERRLQVGEIRRLISRWKWLRADHQYQVDTATTKEESDTLYCKPQREQEEIERQLARMTPETFSDCCTLLHHAIWLLDNGAGSTDDAVVLLRNVDKGMSNAWDDDMTTARKDGMEKMRSLYVMNLEIANNLGTSEKVNKIYRA